MFTLKQTKLLLAAVLLLLSVGLQKSFSQFKTTNAPNEYAMGKVFVIALPDTIYSSNGDAGAEDNTTGEEVWAYVYSAVDNKLTVLNVGGTPTKVDMKAGEFKQIEIATNNKKVNYPFVVESFVASKAAMRIEAEQPVVCYVYVSMKQLAEIYTAVPVEAWGTDYVVASLPAETVANTSVNGLAVEQSLVPAGGQALIIAAHDNTVISYSPACQLDPEPAAGYSVTLNANEAYLISSAVDTSVVKFDLSGTRISASKPISVISGSSRARVNNDLSSITSNTCRNLLMDALAPTDAQGTQYVYMPTLDGKQPVTTNTQQKGKRQFELVRAYGTTEGKTTGKFLDAMTGAATTFNLTENAVTPLNTMKFIPQFGRYIETDKPSQMVKFSSAVIAFDPNAKLPPRGGGGRPRGQGGNPSATLPAQQAETNAPYMVNLVPREQWVSFAPFFVPFGPNTDIENFYGVATDSANIGKIRTESGTILNFNKSIPGTPYVWAMGTVNGGAHFIESTNGGKFYAEIFGVSTTGQEIYIPGSANNAAEYDETFSLAYGFPAAPNRFAYRKEDTVYKKLRKDLKLGYGDSLALRMSDTIAINSKMDCSNDTIAIQVLNTQNGQSFVGLRSVELANVVNAKISYIEPSAAAIDVAGETNVKVAVMPIDISKDASATVVIKDRSGKKWTRPYVYQREYVDFSPSAIDFGTVSYGEPSATKEITITNPLQKDVNISEIKLYKNNQGYEILNMPTLPLTLKPLEQYKLQVRVSPTIENATLTDVIKVRGGCAETEISLKAVSLRTCIYVDDLVLPTMEVGQTKTGVLNICCREGRLTFSNPKFQEVVEWANKTFIIDPADIAALKSVILPKDSCAKLRVSYTATTVGEQSTVVKVHSNAQTCYKDSGVISALVREPGKPLAKIIGHDFGKNWVVKPNNCTKNNTAQYEFDIWVNNEGGANYTVKSIALVGQDATDGVFSFGTSPAITPGLIVFYGDSLSSRKSQKIIFKPTQEKMYSCKVVLTTEDGQVREADLIGEGIESHVSITGFDWGTVKTLNVPYTEAVVIKGLKTRKTTIYGVSINGDPEFKVQAAFVLPTQQKPIVIDVDESWSIPVEFKPTFDGRRTATICVTGDFSTCDDSCAALTGNVGKDPVFGANAAPVRFNKILSCSSDSNFIVVANTGDQDLLIKTINQPSNPAFAVGAIKNLVVKANGQVQIPVFFSPLKMGEDSTTVIIELFDDKGLTIKKTLAVPLSGSAEDAVTNTAMRRDYTRKQPTGNLNVPINLDKSIDAAKLTKLVIDVNYGLNTIYLLNGVESEKATLVKNTILDGWDVKINKNVQSQGSGGFFAVELTAPAGKYLKSTGPLLNLNFGLFVGDKDTNQIFYNISSPTNKCVVFNTVPGFVEVEQICGTKIRLIELTGSTYALQQNAPNPFNPSTDIEFSLGLDGKTTLDIYNESGAKVATLLNQNMNAGKYRITWDATAYPSGMYYYRLTSGVWTKTNAMMLQK